MGYYFPSKYWDKIPVNTFCEALIFTRLGRAGSQYYNTGVIMKAFFNWSKETWAFFPYSKGPGFFLF